MFSIVSLSTTYLHGLMLVRDSMSRCTSDSTLTITCYSHVRALTAGLPRQDHVWITSEQLDRFHNNEFDEMLCKLDSAKYARVFQQNPTYLPGGVGYFSNERGLSVESSSQRISTHFFCFVVETKRFVGRRDSSVCVILTRQTCGQRSSWAVESKRRALGNCLSE